MIYQAAYRALVCFLFLVSSPEMDQDVDSKIAFYSPRTGRDDIFIMNADGSDVQVVTKGEYGGKCPDLSSDGSQMVFVSMRDGNSEIYLMDLKTGVERRLTNLSSTERQPKWSPDGSQITFQSDRDGNYEIYIMDAGGDNWQRLTFTEAEELWPDWSPDGKQIAFSSNRDGNWEIYTVNTDGSGLRRLTNSDLNETGVSWSPDGTRLAFRSGPARQFQGNIHVMNVDGTHEVTLTDFDGVEENPTWSPDGRRIVFQSMMDGDFDLYVMDSDGSNLRNLTNNESNDYWPSWVSTPSGSQTDVRLPASTVELNILYDNYSGREGMSPAHGFSCLIKAGGETLLLDAGGDGELLMSNMSAGGFNPREIDAIAVTHCHSDHIGGLPSVLNRCGRKARVYLPGRDLPKSIIGRALEIIPAKIDSAEGMADSIVFVEGPQPVCAGVLSTGPLGEITPEQSLVILTDAGVVVITGCAHPGIERIVHRVSELTGEPILLVMGGLHLAAESQDKIDVLAAKLDGLVKYIGPCHCSGDLARERFKHRFGDRYLDLGVGSTLKISGLATEELDSMEAETTANGE